MNPETENRQQWLEVERCPGCESKQIVVIGKLPRQHYNFLGDIIPLREGGISLAECSDCGLYFKTLLPSPGYLTAMFTGKAGTLWDDSYTFQPEKEQIRRMVTSTEFDLLDVGPSNGALLQAFADLPGRRSGLDLFMHPGLVGYLRGEFITGLLDQAELSWSGEPYDVVTAFDVFEHLYNPLQAFRNLDAMLKTGGLVVLETGNVGSAWARKVGPECWYYTNLIEHHVFWRPESIGFHAARHGFEVLDEKEVDHKAWGVRSATYKAKQLLKYAIWWLVPGLYRVLADRFKLDGSIAPLIPYMHDHCYVVLRKL
jgi:SAM-dependent methyltransferase